MAEGGSQDPLLKPYDPFQHPLCWALQDFLQQHKAGGSSAAGGSATSSSLQDTFVKSQDLQAATQVRQTAAPPDRQHVACCGYANTRSRWAGTAGGGAAAQAAAGGERQGPLHKGSTLW